MSAERHDISARRWNQIIDWVNNDNPLEMVAPLLSEYEQEIYRNCQRELAEMREKQGERAALWPVESDW